MRVLTLLLALALLPSLPTPARSQGARPNGRGTTNLSPASPSQSVVCNPHFRSIDGTCTNPQHKLWGSVSTPQFSYHRRRSTKNPKGARLPSPRLLSNLLCTQHTHIPNARALAELVTFFGQFLDHNLVATPVAPAESMDIPIPPTDPVFANFSGALPFSRSVRVQLRHAIERPINTLSSAIDLAAIYGSDKVRARAMRDRNHGKLQTSPGNLLQVNTHALRNAPTSSSAFFLSGDHRANEHPVLTAFHTLFVREHNRLCDELRAAFPLWTDDDLYNVARKINGAYFQKIVYQEFIPAMTGRHLFRYTGFRPYVNPTVSDIFSTAAFRVGHTMVGNTIKRRDVGNKRMPSFDMQQMFFRPRSVMKQGIEPFLRGAMYHRAQEVDLSVHEALRNFLFTGIPQEKGFDLVSLNIQRGRDHALPTFNQIRRLFHLKPARRFRHITKNRAVQSKLATAYGTPDRVEAWVGMVAEDHVRGASMGKTMMAVWRAEFTRLRDGDVFFYRGWNLFPFIIYQKMPGLRRMLYGPETLRQIILRNTKITEEEIGPTVWRVNGKVTADRPPRGRFRFRRGRRRRHLD